MNKIGIITDDMTGTMTCGVLLAKAGIKACSYFSPENLSGAETQDAIILSANSRNLKADQAKENVKAAYRSLAQLGATYFTKRIDTTFRGGIGVEVDALLDELPADTIAVMAAAMPDTKRIVVGGYSVIDSVILSETGAAKDVLKPVTQSHIPTMMRSQSNKQVGEINLNVVLQGEQVLKQKLATCKQNGDRIIVVDAVSNQHLALIAKAVHELAWNVVCVDPGAFTQQLALCRGFGNLALRPAAVTVASELMKGTAKVVVVAGSATDVTKRQIELLSTNHCVKSLSINVRELLNLQTAQREVERAVLTGNIFLQDPECSVLVIETAASGERLNLQEAEKEYQLPTGTGSNRINQGLGQIVDQILFRSENKKSLAGIYMTGGDTLVTVLQTLGAAGICLIDTVLPQTNLGQIIGGEFEGVKIVGKGGLIGDDETALKAVNRLFVEANK